MRKAPPDLAVGYLAQALVFAAGATVGDVMRQAIEGLYEAERQLARLAQRLSNAEDEELDHLMDAYGDALARFEMAGGYRAPGRIDAILTALGLSTLDQETPVSILSGGQKTRLGLARLLLNQPRILLLDEPTNHLDIKGLEWLERFLAAFDGTVLIVVHDRYFIERFATAVWSVERGTIQHRHLPRRYIDLADMRHGSALED